MGGPAGPNRAAVCGISAALLAYGFLGWPVAVLAQRSLLVHMGQQCALLLAIAPLLVIALGSWSSRWMSIGTRSGRILRALTTPITATLIFNTVVIGSFVPAVMNAAVRHPAAGAALDLALLAAGIVMWTPVLGTTPVSHGLRRTVRAGYLIIQSIVPSFASLVFIFDRAPIYDVFRTAPRTIGITPLVDQQLAGALAKIVGLAVMLGAAGAILLRSDTEPEPEPSGPTDAPVDGGPDSLPDVLTWDHVEQELRRVGFRESGDG